MKYLVSGCEHDVEVQDTTRFSLAKRSKSRFSQAIHVNTVGARPTLEALNSEQNKVYAATSENLMGKVLAGMLLVH
jgi:hypothetical protein